MRTTLLLLGVLTAPSAAAWETSRTLELQRAASGITEVHIKAGVGEVEILAAPEPTILVRVEVTAGRGSWRSSRRLARELDDLELTAKNREGTLELALDPQHRGTDWHEEWSVRLPPHLARAVTLGVGDVRILDAGGPVSVDVGVGQVRLEGSYAAYGPISAAAGVGDVVLRTPAGREHGSGFVGHVLRCSGPGTAVIEIKTGVGDVDIRLH